MIKVIGIISRGGRGGGVSLFSTLQRDTPLSTSFTVAAAQIQEQDCNKQTCALFPKTDPWLNSRQTSVVPLYKGLCAGSVHTRCYRAQVPASFSSRQTPSARWGGFPNNSIVKTGEMRNMATLQTQHAQFFPPYKSTKRGKYQNKYMTK